MSMAGNKPGHDEETNRWRARSVSAHRRPSTVGIAASGAARDLRPAVDIDGVGVLPALQSVRLVGGAGNHRAVTAGIGVLPRHRRARLAALERLHLRRIGALLVLVVHRRADAVADEAADRRTRDPGGDALASVAAELRADQPAGDSANQRAGVLLRSLSCLGSAAARGR